MKGIINLFIFSVLIVSCQSNVNEKNKDFNSVKSIKVDSSEALIRCVKFSRNYIPKQYGISLENLPNSFVEDLKIAYNYDEEKIMDCIYVILLRLYRYHLSLSSQSYSLRGGRPIYEIDGLKDDYPISYFFFMYTKEYDLNKDFLSSALILDWVERKQLRNMSKVVKKEYIKTKELKRLLMDDNIIRNSTN